MRINSLYIKKYKNIKEQTFDFSNHNGLTVIIGNNGSGKSNLLEAISSMFYNLYRDETVYRDNPGDYKIKYMLSEGGSFTVNSHTDDQLISSLEAGKDRDPKSSKIEFGITLPKRIIAIYSGEEDRLKRSVYLPFLNDYIKRDQIGLPQMLFLDKTHWDIALLCLVHSDLTKDTKFCEEILFEKAILSFRFNLNPVTFIKTNEITTFIDAIKSDPYYPLERFSEKFKDYDTNTLFQYLYFAKSQAKPLIESISISFDGDRQYGIVPPGRIPIVENSLDTLSEGIKKRILVTAALEFAGQEDSLFLLDEPDSHVHVENKSKLIDLLSTYTGNRHIFLSTHSPTIAMNEKCKGRIINMWCEGKGDVQWNNGGDNIVPQITSGLWHAHDGFIFLGTQKHIILVEGKLDKLYISKAKEMLSPEYDDLNFVVFPVGGIDNYKHFGLDTLKPKPNQKIICYIDNDIPQGKTKLQEIAEIYNQTINSEDSSFKINSQVVVKVYPKPTSLNEDCNVWDIEDFFDKDKLTRLYRKEAFNWRNTLLNSNIKSIDKLIEKKITVKKFLVTCLEKEKLCKDTFMTFNVLFDDIKSELYPISKSDTIKSPSPKLIKPEVSQPKKTLTITRTSYTR